MKDVKEKKGFFDSVSEAALSRDGMSMETLPASVWQSFKLSYSGKFSTILKISTLFVLSCLPIVVWSIVMYYLTSTAGRDVPYAANLGIGYMFVGNAVLTGFHVKFLNAMLQFSVVVPCLAFMGVGLGGIFYSIRKLIWNEKLSLFRDFWTGVKSSWHTGILGGLLSGAGCMFMVFNFTVFDAYSMGVVGKVFGIIGSIILFTFLCIYSVYMVSLSANYKMSFGELLSGAFKLTVGRIVPNLIMALLCAVIGVGAWLLGTYMADFAVYVYALILFVGVYFCAAICTVNTHRQFDRIINRSSSDNTPVVAVYKKSEAKTDKTETKKKTAQYVNPKKGKKKTSDETEKRVALPENIKGGENGLDEDLSIYIDTDEE